MSLKVDEGRSGRSKSRSRSRDGRSKDEPTPERPKYEDVREPSYIYPEDDLDDRYGRRSGNSGKPAPTSSGALPYPGDEGHFPGDKGLYGYDPKQPVYATASPSTELPYRTARDRDDDKLPGSFPIDDYRDKDDDPRARHGDSHDDKYGGRPNDGASRFDSLPQKYSRKQDEDGEKDRFKFLPQKYSRKFAGEDAGRASDREDRDSYKGKGKERYGEDLAYGKPSVPKRPPRPTDDLAYGDDDDAHDLADSQALMPYIPPDNDEDPKTTSRGRGYPEHDQYDQRREYDQDGKRREHDQYDKYREYDQDGKRREYDQYDQRREYDQDGKRREQDQYDKYREYDQDDRRREYGRDDRRREDDQYDKRREYDQYDQKRREYDQYDTRREYDQYGQRPQSPEDERRYRHSRGDSTNDPYGSPPNVATADPNRRDRDRRGDLLAPESSGRSRDKSRERSRKRDKSSTRDSLQVEPSRRERSKSRDKRDKHEKREKREKREKSRERSRSPLPPYAQSSSLAPGYGAAGLGAGLAAGMAGGMSLSAAPGSPLLESYRGTYQDCSPMPSPLLLPTQNLGEDSRALEPLSPIGSDMDDGRRKGRRARFHDPEDITTQLATALKGHKRPDTVPLIEILPSLTHEQVMELRKEYKKIVKTGSERKGVNIAKHIRSRLKDEDPNLMKACYAVVLGKWESEAYWANFWYQGDKTRRELLIESLMGRTNAEIWHIKEGFSDKKYSNSLTKCMKAELREDKFKKAVLMVLDERRMEEFDEYGRLLPLDEALVDKDVDDLRRAVRSEKGGETAMINIVVQRSDSHLRAILTEYERLYASNFARDSLRKSGNLVGELLAHILNGVINRPVRDALLLHHAITASRKDGLRRELLISRLVRFHWDANHMRAVKLAYRERYGRGLEESVREATKGEWGQFCCELCIARMPDDVRRFDKVNFSVA